MGGCPDYLHPEFVMGGLLDLRRDRCTAHKGFVCLHPVERLRLFQAANYVFLRCCALRSILEQSVAIGVAASAAQQRSFSF